MAARLDIDVPIWRGDTVDIPIVIDDSGTPVNLQGAKIIFTLKLDPNIPDADAGYIYEALIPDPDTDGAQGKHTIRIERGELAELPLVSHIYQVIVVYFPDTPQAEEITYVWGTVPIEDS